MNQTKLARVGIEVFGTGWTDVNVRKASRIVFDLLSFRVSDLADKTLLFGEIHQSTPMFSTQDVYDDQVQRKVVMLLVVVPLEW